MIYDRQCNACEELFEVNCRMGDKSNDHACPFCGSIDGEWRPSAPAFSMKSERFMTKKKDAGFQEVIQKIQERNKRTEISKR